MMGVAQVAGIVVALADSLAVGAGWPGGSRTWRPRALVVERAARRPCCRGSPSRVPPPGGRSSSSITRRLRWSLLRPRPLRAAGAHRRRVALVLIVSGADLVPRRSRRPARTGASDSRCSTSDRASRCCSRLRGVSVLVDTGGAPFGGGGFDIGAGARAGAVGARHPFARRAAGDPRRSRPPRRRARGARGFRPRDLWRASTCRGMCPRRRVADARARGSVSIARAGGRSLRWDGVALRVLHPPRPDWERRACATTTRWSSRSCFGDVALLLTGDIGAEVERAIAPYAHARAIRILKVAHHGSRTSSSAASLEAWRPQIALISCGRGTVRPSRARRAAALLERIGAEMFRTDRDGQITIETDGRIVSVADIHGAHVDTEISEAHEGTKDTKKTRRRSDQDCSRTVARARRIDRRDHRLRDRVHRRSVRVSRGALWRSDDIELEARELTFEREARIVVTIGYGRCAGNASI